MTKPKDKHDNSITRLGICDDCKKFSKELVYFAKKRLCPNCLNDPNAPYELPQNRSSIADAEKWSSPQRDRKNKPNNKKFGKIIKVNKCLHYDDKYKVYSICPYCGNNHYYNLDAKDYKKLDNDFNLKISKKVFCTRNKENKYFLKVN